MKYYNLNPEVAGGIGDRSIVNWATHPPVVQKLHYEFDGWLGGSIITSFPCFAVTAETKKAIEAGRLTGATFDDMLVSKSDLFNELHPDRALPQFFWLKVSGVALVDDFAISESNDLIVSHRALTIFETLGLSDSEVLPYSAERR